MTNVFSNDLQILRKKNRTFCESFKISLSKLKLEKILDNSRQFDSKNAAKLLKRFHLEKCNRLESKHYVFALVSKANLSQSLQPHSNSFEKSQHFDSSQSLLCIDDEHRLKVANRFLAEKDRWWIANLYFNDMRSRLWLLRSLLSIQISTRMQKTRYASRTSIQQDTLMKISIVKFVSRP